MYLPEHFAEHRTEALHRVLRGFPLGTIVTHTERGLDANHIPFELDASSGTHGTLRGHVAHANPLWTEVPSGSEVLVIFQGHDGYISPSWYPSKHETHRHVPTWNYEVVHAHGKLKIVDDETFVAGVVARLTRAHEAGEPQPWRMRMRSRLPGADARDDRRHRSGNLAPGRQTQTGTEPRSARPARSRERTSRNAVTPALLPRWPRRARSADASLQRFAPARRGLHLRDPAIPIPAAMPPKPQTTRRAQRLVQRGIDLDLRRHPRIGPFPGADVMGPATLAASHDSLAVDHHELLGADGAVGMLVVPGRGGVRGKINARHSHQQDIQQHPVQAVTSREAERSPPSAATR